MTELNVQRDMHVNDGNTDPAVTADTASTVRNHPVTDKPNRVLFGREDLTVVYDRARELIIRHKLLRLTSFEEIEGIRRLTICNLWRIERDAEGQITLSEFDLVNEIWRPSAPALKFWPNMPFYPVKATRSLDWWRDIISGAIHEALQAAGYDDLRLNREPIEWISVNPLDEEDEGFDPYLTEYVPARGSKLVMSPASMAFILKSRYIGKLDGKTRRGKYVYKDGVLQSTTMRKAARALRACFYRHFLDAEVLSAMMVIDYRDTRLVRYLQYARHRDGLLKVARERRNLLPVLSIINPAHWARDDLFSARLWVRQGRYYTALDRRPLQQPEGKRCMALSFQNSACWHWLAKASPVVVRTWVRHGCDHKMLEHIVQANFQGKVPVYAYTALLGRYRCHQLARLEATPLTGRLLRIFLQHVDKMWREQGFVEVKSWLKALNRHMGDVLDWLRSEGFAQGHPSKNATWQSLQRRTADWHRRIAHENLQAKIAMGEKIRWDSALPETVIDGIVFTPINDGKTLVLEGHEVDHCIAGYIDEFRWGNYRAYAVCEPDGTRSTLGIRIDETIDDPGVEITLDQHSGFHNAEVSRAAALAGEKLVELYRQAYLAQMLDDPV